MIQFLELKNFRAFEHIRFEDLGRANLIIGRNNTGKTSVLEALVMKMGSGKQIMDLPSTFRDNVGHDDFRNFWSYIARNEQWEGFEIRTDDQAFFAQQKTPSDIHLVDKGEESKAVLVGKVHANQVHFGGVSSRIKTTILPTKAASPQYISELFNQIAPLDPRNEDRLEHLLCKSIEPRLKRLRYAKPKETNTHLVYVDLGEGPMLPFTQLGQAFTRTLEIYCEIFANQPKIILIDEIENGLYYEGMEDFWKGLFEVLEDQDVQLFATTHSRECMEAAHRAAAGRAAYPLRFLRLDRRVEDPGKIVATTFGQEEMQTAMDSKIEMR
jgi:AAA15 family ATPase/GTPase